MSEKKEITPVEWLESQLKKSKYYFKLIEDLGFQSSVVATDVFKLAKQMEKKQIENAYRIGKIEANMPREFNVKGEQYYKETYGE